MVKDSDFRDFRNTLWAATSILNLTVFSYIGHKRKL